MTSFAVAATGGASTTTLAPRRRSHHRQSNGATMIGCYGAPSGANKQQQQQRAVTMSTGGASRRRSLVIRAASSSEGGEGKGGEEDVGAGLKAVWYGAEAVGKVVGMTKEKEESSSTSSSSSSSSSSAAAAAAAAGGKLEREQVMALLKEDYDSSYFVSGVGELSAYVPDCEFSDPFVAFKGVDRFKQNVGNLGGMMEDIDLKITQWEEKDDSLVTSWRFSCILDLPWRPKLAAAGGTTHVLDADNRVVKHIERWDVEPKKAGDNGDNGDNGARGTRGCGDAGTRGCGDWGQGTGDGGQGTGMGTGTGTG